ncbi:hypothetical protein F7725_012800 [Dissostichus mawsoni]|uniref:E1A-binding protein p400 n=1 Tax=Dissostichus mawsoni TaxID=36200 RepID=A0A7J5YRW9_DISMA|nr:hypothetical protein F7725_012800 [Dissostichus mawsoni]
MHHGSGSQNMQRQLQRSKPASGAEAEEQQQPTMAVTQQQATANHPQSPVTTFSSAASPSAPQSPNYQIIMSRSPVTGQNMNITLQNVGQMVTGNQQITLTPLPIQNPSSPGFQHATPQWRFEHAPSSYIQVTSPVPQPMQPQSPTQHSPVTRPGAPATALGVCGQSPTRFVDAGMLVRQISLNSPSGSGHFVYQEGTGLAQIAPATPGQIQLASPGAPGSVRERRLSQPHSQTGGTIHHHGPQSPVATGTSLPTLGSPNHITTSNLPPQISSIIQGQLARPMIFEKTSQGVVAGVGTTASFTIPSSIPPSNQSLTSPTQGISNNPLAPNSMAVATMRKQVPKKLEEIAPSTPEIAQLRKLCLEHHTKKMDSLKEVFKEYLIELFFLQHLQGNMMDYVAFKKKPCVPLYTYLRQNDLDLEDEEEEEEQSEVINDEVKVVTGKDGQAVTPVAIATQLPANVSAAFSVQQQFQGHQVSGGTITNPGDMDAFKRQQAMADCRTEADPASIRPIQRTSSAECSQPAHPSSQLPGRMPHGALPMAGMPMTLSQQAQLLENIAQSGGQLQAQVKLQAGVLAAVNPHTQLQAQLQQQMQPGLHLQLQPQQQQPLLQAGQATVALARPGAESNQPGQRIMTNSISMTSMSPAPLSTPNSVPTPHTASPLRPYGSNINPSTQSKLTGTNGISAVKIGGFGQSATMQSSQEGSQDKQVEQAKLESQVHQRISDLRKEGQWSASRLPKLMEASRPKSHWDYLLEEMHTIAREVVEIKLQFEIYEKKLKALSLQKASAKVPDEESTIEEQGGWRGKQTTKQSWLSWPKMMPLDALKKQYARLQKACPLGSPPEAVLIDSLLNVEQYRGADKASDSERKPARDIAEVAAATELILPKGSFRTTSTTRSPAPLLLHGSLREYQQIGVDWLVNLHKKNLNGILADETGLGKTVQTVAYMAQLAGQEGMECHKDVVRFWSTGIWGPHLIVVRTCKLLNWEVEFKRWCPGLKILLYLGNRRERRNQRMSHFLRRKWRHLVLDEVQLIKSMTEKHWETIFALRSEQRVLLINTPLQNTLKELWTMIHFLLPGITRSYSDFPVKAGTDQNQDYCHKLVIRLHRMIQPFILRRSKRDVEKQLPKKYEHILKCRLSTRQKSLYEDILTQPGAQEALKTGHFVSVLQVLMQLQRVCNHPELVAPRETSSSYFCSSLQYNAPSLVLGAIRNDSSKISSMSIFDLINNENRLTRYQTEEAHLCFHQPVSPEQGQVPRHHGNYHSHYSRGWNSFSESADRPSCQQQHCSLLWERWRWEACVGGGSVALGQTLTPISQPALAQVPRPALAPSHAIQPSLLSQRLVLTSQAQARLPSGDVVKIAQLANIAGNQNRISQPETPVTLQFQGNKFTLSPSQLRQLTTDSPCSSKIVSAPGQQIIRPQGSMVMQTMQQTVPASNASVTPGTPHPALSTAQQGVTSNATSSPTKLTAASHAGSQESSEEKTQQLKERLSRLFEANERRCSRRVVYGSDLLQACTLTTEPSHSALTAGGWRWVGRESCLRAQRTCVATTAALQSALLTVEDRLQAANSLIKRLVCVVPPAVAPPPHLYAANPPVPYSLQQKSLLRRLQEAAAPHSADIHHHASRPLLCCDDLLLMQMDSGKLEALAILLQKLRSESRRVLIFTQMVKMLDILEAFLDHRQLTYVRVDESFSPDERQENIRKFNRNRNVFCSILTNRCCSAVGTLFDADTIIFYDTDLNPSMDARAQEWCDKIGRSKDIHIYRLESGNSIEEKLLKNGTKDLIREVAAQGTDYTLAYLTQRTIQDLFEVEAGSGEKVEEFVVLHQEPSASEAISPRVARPYIQALHSINLDALSEEEEEQQHEEELAGKESTKDNQEEESKTDEEPAQQEELNAVIKQLTPIERYALHYLEYLHVSDDQTALKERLECSKRGWELQQLQKLKEEEEERHFMEGDEDLFTYTREDAYNMRTAIQKSCRFGLPTPPSDDNDIYIDSVMMLMYDTAPMPESKLPPVYVRKEHKRLKMDPSVSVSVLTRCVCPAAARKKKKGHGETVIPPRSLFEKASMLKVRREGKDQKKNFSLKQQAPFAKPLPSLVKPVMEAGQDNPEWLISEDWALLQAVKQLLELPLNLTIVSPAHTPNWDLVSDVVNSCSRIYRSPKQCRNRYENVIIPREEGKSKNSRPLRTCQIYTQDDNATHIQLYNSRFELMKIIASKRSPPIKPLLGMNPFQKNPKHASVLAESGISYDKPLPPIQVASQRAERIAKEKKSSRRLSSWPSSSRRVPGALAAPGQALTPAAGQALVPQAATVPGAAAVPNAAVLAGAIKNATVGTTIQAATVGGNVIVNTLAGVPPSPFQANKRLASPVITGTLSPAGAAGAQVVHTQQRTVTAAAAPAEVVAIATGVRAVTPVTASAVVTTTLSPVQSQTRPLVTQATGMQLQQGKPLTSAQMQIIRQQQLQQHQQQQAASPQIKAVGKPQARLPTQAGQTAQVTLTKPPVVSVPAVVSSAGVTTLPVTVAGISIKKQQQQQQQAAAAAQQKAGQPQLGQTTVQQKSQQKVTYTTTTQLQSGIKTQFFTTSIAQAQKPTGAQQIQVAKLPQIVQQQPTVANIQQIVSSPQQLQAQTVTLTQAAASSPAQVQMISAGSAAAQAVQQKLLQQQVVTAATSPQIQTPPPHSPAQQTSDALVQPAPPQQPAKGQARQGGIRAKTPAKPSS